MKKNDPLDRAKRLMQEAQGQQFSTEQRCKRAVLLASELLEAANIEQTGVEKRLQKQLGRMMADPQGKVFTTAMTDTSFRSQRPTRIARQITALLCRFGVPRYLGWGQRMQLWGFKWVGRFLSWLTVPLANHALRKQMSGVILPGERHSLKHHLRKRQRQRVRVNLNRLGEAILGEEEAKRRLALYLEDLSRPEIEYISIKISTICSQLNLLAWEETLALLKPRLRELYRAAIKHRYPSGEEEPAPKFVNLDMEEYRDLHLTVDLFQQVLDEPEFQHLPAGIVLQAYVPDSWTIQQRLTRWAMQRVEQGGAPIKIRVVKGANLAMERVESSLHGWPQAPYMTKVEVDANYKRMVTYGCQPHHARAVHLGIGSHNLFDIAYTLLLRTEQGVEREVTFEMLEGMADHMRRVVQQLAGSILLYCPAARKEEFQHAVAYLIRRLDENTGPENFLRHVFGIHIGVHSGDPDWKDQIRRFQRSCAQIDTVSTEPRRNQDRQKTPSDLPLAAPFDNEPDTDIALPHNRKWAVDAIARWKDRTIAPIPLVIAGQEIIYDRDREVGRDPSNPKKKAYQYALATVQDVEEALEKAHNGGSRWSEMPIAERSKLLAETAKQFRRHRGELIGAMARDGGKRFAESDPEVSEAIDFIEYYRRRAEELHAGRDVRWTPKGPTLVTPPWNFPCAIPSGGIAAALAAGNPVLFKPAPEAVLIGWELVKLFWAAGIPRDVLQYINCVDDPVGSHLIQDPRVSVVILTGGTTTARLFFRLRPGIDLLAETGGKNAIIVSDLADRDLAVKTVVQSAFSHSGQKCSAASLLILHKEMYDNPRFLHLLRDAAASLKVGSAWEMQSMVTPLIQPPQGPLKKGLTTLEKGESWLLKPRRDPHNPNLWSPGIKLGTKPGGYTHQTEFFGPVLAVIRAENFKEALIIANETPYGLTSGIQSLDDREIDEWLHTMEAGNLYVNRGITGAIVRRQPFGGCKASGFGPGAKAGGPNYLCQLMWPKQIEEPRRKAAMPSDFTPYLLLLSADERDVFRQSLESACYWWERMRAGTDPSKLLGQDNIFRYVPRKQIIFRLTGEETPLDLLRVLALCTLCGTPIEISGTDKPAVLKRLPHQFINERNPSFCKRIKMLERPHIRMTTPPNDDLICAAASVGGHIAAKPVLSNGRFELLHYIREVAVSVDYHRYGNLGEREEEERKNIL